MSDSSRRRLSLIRNAHFSPQHTGKVVITQRLATPIKLSPSSQRPIGHTLDFFRAVIRHYRPPSMHSDGRNLKRSRNLGSALEMRDHIGLQHSAAKLTPVARDRTLRETGHVLTLVTMTVTTTLQSRLREAMKDADITPAQLWQRCKGKVTKTAFYKWINGPSKTLKSNHASMLARILRVREKWLSTGIGPKSIDAHEAVDATFYELARAITAAAPFFLRIVELAQQLEREAAQADAPPQKRSLKKRS